jgi:hypothetical protein
MKYLQQLWGYDVAIETVIDGNPTFLAFSDNKLAIRKSV